MTMRKHFEGLLDQHAMFPDQIKAIMDAVAADPANAVMHERWNDSTEGYPEGLMNGLWCSVCHHVVTWMDANKPKHFMRPAFERYLPKKQ